MPFIKTIGTFVIALLWVNLVNFNASAKSVWIPIATSDADELYLLSPSIRRQGDIAWFWIEIRFPAPKRDGLILILNEVGSIFPSRIINVSGLADGYEWSKL